MVLAVSLFLTVFYAGAVLSTGYAWLSAWRGLVSYSALRDLTGIANRAVLRRNFGLATVNGSFRVTIADVIRHRRRVGAVLSDVPVHGLFLLSLAYALAAPGTPAATVIPCVAGLHAAIVAAAALVIAAGDRQLSLP